MAHGVRVVHGEEALLAPVRRRGDASATQSLRKVLGRDWVAAWLFLVPCLLVLIGPKEGREYTLDRARTTLGSSDSCDVYLPGDPGIERVHAYIRRDKQGLMIKPASPTARGSSLGSEPAAPPGYCASA